MRRNRIDKLIQQIQAHLETTDQKSADLAAAIGVSAETYMKALKGTRAASEGRFLKACQELGLEPSMAGLEKATVQQIEVIFRQIMAPIQAWEIDDPEQREAYGEVEAATRQLSTAEAASLYLSSIHAE